MDDDTKMLWDKAAEAAVLGSMIQDSKCIPGVMTRLTEDSFFDDFNKLIFQAIINLFTSKGPMDIIRIYDELEAHHKPEDFGGRQYVAQVLQSTPSAANVAYYTDIIKKKERGRQLIEKVGRMQDVLASYDDDKEQQILDLALEIEPVKTVETRYDIQKCATGLAMQLGGPAKSLLRTGFKDVDSLIGGFTPAEVVIIAGRPSMGKTTLATDLALNMAGVGKSGLFFTLEMTAAALVQRASASLGGVRLIDIKRWGFDGLPEDIRERYCAGALKLSSLPIVIHEAADTPEKIIAIVKSEKKLKTVDFIVIDYIQLMHAARGNENRQQEITTISRKLCNLAKFEHVPVIVLSQLNRAVEGREKHRPRLSDLRESGSLEQDADYVLMVHREDYYRRNESPADYQKDLMAELIVTKSRNGPTGIVNLIFNEDAIRFEDVLTDVEQEKRQEIGETFDYRA